ncbi:Retrovirus-related Pol polyprotein from transposon RE2 [Bienertia sinuspersici]
MDYNHAGMVCCFHANTRAGSWILDSGASNHMTGDLRKIIHPCELSASPAITLPNRDSAVVTYKGKVLLKNDMELKDVLYVPSFNHNLLSIQKLLKENDWKVEFRKRSCIISDLKTNEVKGIGRQEGGLYFLMEEPIRDLVDLGRKMIGKN